MLLLITFLFDNQLHGFETIRLTLVSYKKDMDSHHIPTQQTKKVAPDLLYRPMFYWSLPFVFLSFALPVYSKALGASALEIGGLFSIFTATTLVLRPLIGWAVDRFGRKQFLIAAFGLYAISMLLFALSSSMLTLYISRFVQGIGSSLLWIAVNTIVADLSVKEDLGRAMGRVKEMTARGGMIGAFAGFFLITTLSEDLGWKIIFFGFSAFTILAGWLAWRNIPETRVDLTRLKNERVPISPKFFRLLVVIFITGASEAMLGPIFLIFLSDRFTTDIDALAFAAIPAGLVWGFLAGRLGSLSDRFGRIKMMSLGLAGSGLLSMLLPQLPSIIWLGVFYALNAIAWATSEPAEAALVAEFTGRNERGMGYGLHDFAGNIGAAFGPLLGGWLYDQVGQAVPFYINGVVLFLSAVWIVLRLEQKKPQVK